MTTTRLTGGSFLALAGPDHPRGRRGRQQRTLPDVQAVTLDEGTEKPDGPALELTLAARSFALVEASVSP